jgi:hypothetical protein
LPRSDFAKAQFRAKQHPFHEQAVLLLRRFETALRREPETNSKGVILSEILYLYDYQSRK